MASIIRLGHYIEPLVINSTLNNTNGRKFYHARDDRPFGTLFADRGTFYGGKVGKVSNHEIGQEQLERYRTGIFFEIPADQPTPNLLVLSLELSNWVNTLSGTSFDALVFASTSDDALAPSGWQNNFVYGPTSIPYGSTGPQNFGIYPGVIAERAGSNLSIIIAIQDEIAETGPGIFPTIPSTLADTFDVPDQTATLSLIY